MNYYELIDTTAWQWLYINGSFHWTEEPKEAVLKLKTMAFEMAKNYGFEINEQMEWPEIKEKVMEAMREKGVPVGKYRY